MTLVTGGIDLAEASRARGGSQRLRAYVARPEGSGPWPAVVMAMEAFGVNDDMRSHADRIAGWGYVVVVPDLYADGGAKRCLVATMRAMQSGTGRAFVDLETARLWAVAQPWCTGRAGVIGFCMGGGFALLACDRDRYDVASANYGQVPEDLSRSCPVVGSYGEKDPSLRGAAATLRSRLASAGVAHDVVSYPDAGHAFLNEAPPGPAALSPLLRVAGFGASPQTREDAWGRIQAFFGDHLPPGPA
ncbi:dienelactone hydrolase family protein [Arsenicicoccus bolidensis]|uniref:Dienelactone hydrolase family protein n=1 Tax=Arsenicicoccus bolidensis TaxID=229480 RepID=A0ABS9Q3L5_9MICO|nr:dienelactone hydrolase family protein [Arsenicicoccus bolidensis]MCG7322465.1 dienelactone hydrolase family protein [Arsenicicoccus bolidensis]